MVCLVVNRARRSEVTDDAPPRAVCYTGSRVRKTTTVGVAAVLGAMVVCASAGRALACTCPGSPPPAELVPATSFAAADAVFEGRVMEVASSGAGLEVTLEVVQHWKGIESERATVRTASAGCGVPFSEETSWLVYARRDGEAWTTDLCAGTRRIEDAAAALAELGAGVVPVDITDDDEVEEPAQSTAPRRGGCASCAVGSSSDRHAGGVAVALAVLAFALRRRRAGGQLL